MVRYADYTTSESSAIKRWSHNTRFRVALSTLGDLEQQSLLDYGTADAQMLRIVKESHPDVTCVGYDPHLDEGAAEVVALYPDVEVTERLGALSGRQFDIVTCFETLEHFTDDALNDRVDEIVALVRPDGEIVVSVPIEIGPASVFKNVVRAVSGKRHPGTTMPVVLASLFGAAVRRPAAKAGGYISSHIGFDYRVIPGLFEKRGWKLKRTGYSPVGPLGPLFNSQALFVFNRGQR